MRRQLLLRTFVLLASIGHFAIAGAYAQQASAADRDLERLADARARVVSLEDRVTALEKQETEARVKVLESDMAEVKWLGRGVAIAVVGQLVLGIFGDKRQVRVSDYIRDLQDPRP